MRMCIVGAMQVCVALSVMVAVLPVAVGVERPKTIPIDGHVTINGKAPGEAGKIFFTPTSDSRRVLETASQRQLQRRGTLSRDELGTR